jgi:Tfp pilus assembly protein FimT
LTVDTPILARPVHGCVNERTLTVAVIAVLAVLAVGLAAATLSSTVSTESDGVSGNESTSAVINFQQPTVQETNGSISVPSYVGTPVRALLLTGLLLSTVYVARYWRRYLLQFAGVLVLGLVLYGLLLVDFDLSGLVSGGSGEGRLGGNLFGDGDGANTGTLPTTGFALLSVVGVLALAVVVYRLQFSNRTSASGDSATEIEPNRTGATTQGSAQTAARSDAALHLDDSVENEVYRAWQEMVEHLDVSDPNSTTPGEFERAAVDAGMQHEDVAALTRLFEDVRYGDNDPTDSREQQARELRRRIDRRSDQP